MLVKTLTSRALALLGYEIRRKPVGGHDVTELSGLAFSDFLQYFLQSQDLANFVFVQIGANNGVSNDWLFNFVRKFRLKGILVEPQAETFRELQKNYDGCDSLILENIAISQKPGSQTLYTIRKDLEFLQYANQIASFNYDHIRSQLSKHLSKSPKPGVRERIKELRLTVEGCIEEETVETRTFTDMLARHAIQHYNLLQVDTEGFDFEIIKMAGLDRIKPGLINYEHEHLSAADRTECWNYLRERGYRMFTHAGDTAAYLLN